MQESMIPKTDKKSSKKVVFRPQCSGGLISFINLGGEFLSFQLHFT